MNMKKVLTLFAALILFGSMMVVQATDYYYRGNQNGWGATLMTASTDGYYAYINALSYANNNNENNIFKISLSDNSWDYDCSIVSPGFNETDITNMNSSTNSWNMGDQNNAIYHDANYYVLVYFPNTTINSSNAPVMCASTTLPDNSAPIPSFTFTSGTTIYYDFTGYGSGVDIYPGGNHVWLGSPTAVDEETLGADWTISASTTLFQSDASGWSPVKCTTLPTEGQNMIVSTDGATYTWSTYSGPAIVHTYTVAGDQTAVFGTSWAWDDTDNDMVDQGDGTFLWEKTDIELSSGDVRFKVGQDYSWAHAWPASDYVLNIPSDGIYTITITFTESTTTVAATATKTGEAVVIPTIALHSNITNSEWEASANFVSTDGNITASHTFTNVAAGTYQFGVLKAGSWMSSNSIALTRDNKSVVIENNGDGNATFTADQAGDYTFTWTFAENKLEVTYPDLVTKTIYIQNKTGWANPYLYAWEDGVSDANLLGSWHGAEATGTETIGEIEYLTYTLKESAFPCNIVFNNGLNDAESAQLADYRLTTAQNYYLIAEYGILRDKDATPATYHLYVHNLTGWETFDVYAYGDKEYLGEWPGKAAADDTEDVDNSEYLVYDFQAFAGQTVNMNLIFHNNVGEYVEGDLRQYFTVTEARDYYLTVQYASAWEGKSARKRFRTTGLMPIYGYSYNGDGPVGESWPGAVLGLVNGWYEYVIPEGHTVIFNDGADKPTQTDDLAYAAGDQCLVWKGFSTDAETKFIMTTTNSCDAPVYTTYERTVTNGNYGTIILPVNAHAVTGATLFSIAGKNDDGIFVDEVDQLVKGTPYIFLASANNLVVEYEDGQQFNSSIDGLYALGNNGLVGYIEDDQEYTVTKDAHNYILYNNGLYYVNSDNVKIASNRAFIDWSNVPDNAPAQAPGRKRYSIGVNKTPTAIDQIGSEKGANKIIEEGNLYIIKNGVKYNAQGIIVK